MTLTVQTWNTDSLNNYNSFLNHSKCIPTGCAETKLKQIILNSYFNILDLEITNACSYHEKLNQSKFRKLIKVSFQSKFKLSIIVSFIRTLLNIALMKILKVFLYNSVKNSHSLVLKRPEIPKEIARVSQLQKSISLMWG